MKSLWITVKAIWTSFSISVTSHCLIWIIHCLRGSSGLSFSFPGGSACEGGCPCWGCHSPSSPEHHSAGGSCAGPFTSVAPQPSSQKPCDISCLNCPVLDMEGRLHLLSFRGAMENCVQKHSRQDMTPEPRIMALNTGKKILGRSVGGKIQLGR